MIPVVGSAATGAKYVNKGLKYGEEIADAGKTIKKPTNTTDHLNQDSADEFVTPIVNTKSPKSMSNNSNITEITGENFGNHIIKGKNGRKEIAPNVQYITDENYKYTTDELGRIVDVEVEELILGKGKRNTAMQVAVGREDRLIDDDGGHLIGTQFRGSGDIDNLLAQIKKGQTVRYPDGYPDFTEYAHPTVKPVEIEITSPTNRSLDNKKANMQAGLNKDSDPPIAALNEAPEGYTWHHHQDGKTMILVDKKVHREFTHAGGVSIVNGN